MALVFGGAFEEMLPKFLWVGFPVLLAAVQFFATHAGLKTALLFAVAAGAMEDAVSSLPVMTSASYFLFAAAFTRWAGLPRSAAAVTYPCYQLWLALWLADMGGSVFTRVLAAFPVGLATAFATDAAMSWVWRKAAVNERG